MRDSGGFYKEATQSKGQRAANTLDAELQALLMAMQHAWSRGYKHVVFEGDNQQVMNLINGRSRNFQVHNLVREIQVWKARVTRPKFTWVPKAHNRAADCLATSPLPHSTSFVFHSYVPNFLVHILHEDHISSH